MTDPDDPPDDVNLVSASSVAPASIETLLDHAFGEDRHLRTAYRLRVGTRPIARLSVAALGNDELEGVGLCWPIRLASPEGDHPLVLVGPVAVHRDRQGRGIGTTLMRRILCLADQDDDTGLMLIGDPEYYGRFGFTADATGAWQLPGPVERHRLLARLPAGMMLPRDGTIGPWTGTAALQRAG